MKRFKKILLLFISLYSEVGFSWNLTDVFAGMDTNVTKPGSYRDAAAGYYSGGGFSMRLKHNPVSEPFSLTPPNLKMGCSGIDLYMGSFSMMSSDELIKLAKALGAQAKTYAFQLGLKTFAPQIENLLSQLRKLAMELNEFSVDDCHAIQSIFASALQKDSAMYEMVCKDLSQQSGGKDYFKARENCQSHEKAREEARRNQTLSKEEELTGDYNLFLIAAKKAKVPEDARNMIMSIAGTIVMKDGKKSQYDSLVKNNTNNWSAYLKGGKAKNYQCNGSECLSINLVDSKIDSTTSYQEKAVRKLLTIKKDMLENKAFSVENKTFLSSIGDTFPIYDYLSLEVVTGVSILDKASELIATYMIVHYLNNVINQVKHAAQVLEAKQINDQHIKEYLAELDEVQIFVASKYRELMDVAFNLEKVARFLEKHQVARSR